MTSLNLKVIVKHGREIGLWLVGWIVDTYYFCTTKFFKLSHTFGLTIDEAFQGNWEKYSLLLFFGKVGLGDVR